MGRLKATAVSVILILFLFISARVILAQVKEKLAAKLQGYDAITLPGKEVILKAKLEKDDLFKRDLEDQKVIFRIGAEVLGEAISGEQGIARISHTPAEAGKHEITVALHSDSPYQGDEGRILLLAIPEDRKILVSDIDHTVADISSLKFLTTRNEEVPTLPGAPEALTKLSEKYQVVYITARDDAFMRKTKKWLDIKKFPRAPVFFWDFLGSPSQSHTRYKSEQISEIKKTWKGVEVGVGDRRGDAVAYIENGIKAFIIGDEDAEDTETDSESEKMPDEAIRVESWDEIVAALMGSD